MITIESLQTVIAGRAKKYLSKRESPINRTVSKLNAIFTSYRTDDIVLSKIDENRCKQTLASLPWFLGVQV